MEGVTSPFNTIKSQQRYTSTIVYNEAAPPCITWSTDMTKVTCQGFTVALEDIRTGASQLCEKVERAIWDLCGNAEIPLDIPANLSEDLTNNRVGYSYLDNGDFTTKKYPLLEHLLQDTRNPIAKVGLDNKLDWQLTRIMQFRAIFNEINRDLAVLCFMLPAPPPRGTEFTNLRIRNARLPRNLFKDFGTWFIYQMVKTTNLTGKLSWVPAILPERLSKLLDRFLVLIRPVECIFAQVLDDPVGCAVYQEYLWVQSGKQMQSGEFSDMLSKTTRDFMGCQLGLRPWRHIAIAIMREFNPPRLGQNSINDLLCNHNSKQAQKTYAREINQLPFLTTDVMLESRDACSFWHNTLGFGKQKPPVPFRLLMYQDLLTGSTSSSSRLLPPSTPDPPPVPASAPSDFGPQLAHAMDTLMAYLHTQQQSLKTEINQGMQTAVSAGIEGYMAQSGLLNVIPEIHRLSELVETKLSTPPNPLFHNAGHLSPPGISSSLFHPTSSIPPPITPVHLNSSNPFNQSFPSVQQHSLHSPQAGGSSAHHFSSPSIPGSPAIDHNPDPFNQAPPPNQAARQLPSNQVIQQLPPNQKSPSIHYPSSHSSFLQSPAIHQPPQLFNLPPPPPPDSQHLQPLRQYSSHISSPSPHSHHLPSPLQESISAAEIHQSRKRPSPSTPEENQAAMPSVQRRRVTPASNSHQGTFTFTSKSSYHSQAGKSVSFFCCFSGKYDSSAYSSK